MSPSAFSAPFEAQIVGYGMACPVGLRTNSSVAAMRAGIKVFQESELVFNSDGSGALVSGLSLFPAEATRGARMVELASRAIQEACEPLARWEQRGEVRCFISLPEESTAEPVESPLRAGLEPLLQGRHVQSPFRMKGVVRGDRAGAFAALAAGLDALRRGACWLVLVGGVDSLVSPLCLRALVEEERVLSTRNRGGLIPGEGAGFILLAHPDLELGPAVGNVLMSTVSEATSASQTGLGRSSTLSRSFADIRGRWRGRVDQVISGQTGQERFERSLAHAYLRNSALMPEPMRAWALGTALGDTGAAAGAMGLVVACSGLTRFCARAPLYSSVLVYGESEGGASGASLVFAPTR